MGNHPTIILKKWISHETVDCKDTEMDGNSQLISILKKAQNTPVSAEVCK